MDFHSFLARLQEPRLLPDGSLCFDRNVFVRMLYGNFPLLAVVFVLIMASFGFPEFPPVIFQNLDDLCGRIAFVPVDARVLHVIAP